MKTIGSLTHIAEQEKIYSTRFIGDRLYMVTFKRIDPFFVIDLATPTAPKILGKLKIPGYSDYLHPYDATHIIGVGKETGTNDWGGVSTKGIKLALFDVSDVEHPTQIDKVEIGDAGSDSAALSDHKAFLFDKSKNLLVIPARVVKNDVTVTDKYGTTQPNIWYGAYVFGLTPETGFVLKGTVEHGTGSDRYLLVRQLAERGETLALYRRRALHALDKEDPGKLPLEHQHHHHYDQPAGRGRCALPGDEGAPGVKRRENFNFFMR